MEIRGRDGLRIEELWAKDGARAYIGSMIPGFPNFFMAYGLNTNNWSGLRSSTCWKSKSALRSKE
jgi:4-hydroxyacetophenone monooxygenase